MRLYRNTFLALTLGASFYLGLAVRQPPQIVKHDVFIDRQVAVCAKLPTALNTRRVKAETMKLAAAIPASALKPVR